MQAFEEGVLRAFMKFGIAMKASSKMAINITTPSEVISGFDFGLFSSMPQLNTTPANQIHTFSQSYESPD